MFKILNYKPKNTKIYLQAFKHKSFDVNNNNERLEFLGDSILDFIITKQLYLENPKQEEGFLSQKRAIIVGGKHLNLIGKEIFCDSKIKSKLKTIPKNVYGNILESLIGAIYIDQGIKQAQKFIIKYIYHSKFIKELSDIDYKSKLLNYSHKKRVKIDYRVLKKEGPDHKQEFLIALYIENIKKAEGKASSIKDAEQKAAKKVYNSVLSL